MARKPWEEMTFDEKMAVVEDDFEYTRAEKVQREILKAAAEEEARQYAQKDAELTSRVWNDTRSMMKKLKESGFDIVMTTHDEVIAEKSFLPRHLPKVIDYISPLPKPKPLHLDYASIEARVLKNREFTTQEMCPTQLQKRLKEIAHGRQQKEGCGVAVSCSGTPRSGLPGDEEDPRSG